jgi:putative lipoic acid-binding regulatory protein
MALNTKFDELLEFPCSLSFKVMGVAHPQLLPDVISVIQQIAPGDYSPKIKPSSKGNYHSLAVPIIVNSKEHIEEIYTELNKLEHVRFIL